MVKKTVETQAPVEVVETKRPAPEVEQVVMEDGRTVAFAGKRRMLRPRDRQTPEPEVGASIGAQD